MVRGRDAREPVARARQAETQRHAAETERRLAALRIQLEAVGSGSPGRHEELVEAGIELARWQEPEVVEVLARALDGVSARLGQGRVEWDHKQRGPVIVTDAERWLLRGLGRLGDEIRMWGAVQLRLHGEVSPSSVIDVAGVSSSGLTSPVGRLVIDRGVPTLVPRSQVATPIRLRSWFTLRDELRVLAPRLATAQVKVFLYPLLDRPGEALVQRVYVANRPPLYERKGSRLVPLEGRRFPGAVQSSDVEIDPSVPDGLHIRGTTTWILTAEPERNPPDSAVNPPDSAGFLSRLSGE